METHTRVLFSGQLVDSPSHENEDGDSIRIPIDVVGALNKGYDLREDKLIPIHEHEAKSGCSLFRFNETNIVKYYGSHVTKVGTLSHGELLVILY